jgi:hypothetical protein
MLANGKQFLLLISHPMKYIVLWQFAAGAKEHNIV